MRIVCSRDNGKTREELAPEALEAALEDESILLWVDLDGENPEEAQRILSDIFLFHPLAVDDAINEVLLPKVDDWQSYLYLVLRGISHSDRSKTLLLPELDIFVADHYLVTFHQETIDALERVWETSERDERLMQNGPAYILYRLIEELMEDYIRALEEMEDQVETVEAEVLRRPHPSVQERIMGLKHTILKVRRVVVIQREVLNQLARDPIQVIPEEDRVYFRDVYDHIIRVYDLVDGLRDLIGSALELYLAAVNNRMNDVMKTLTVITTLFMPLTFITGFFGMNFFQPVVPALGIWTASIAFVLTLVIMAFTPFIMFLWMRRRAWM
jgi:magnesium transporter